MDRFTRVELELSSFLQTWPFSSITRKRADQRLTREDMDDQLLHRIYSDERFRNEFLANPRFVMAIAVEESLGIDKYQFVRGVGDVHVLQESRELLYLILPSCHKGCLEEGITEAPEEHCGRSCHVCGLTLSKAPDDYRCSAQKEPAGALPISRKEIEDQIKKRARFDPGFKQAFTRQPVEVYTACARELCGGQLPHYLAEIKDIRVFEEGLEEIYFIVPAACRADAAS